MTYRNLLSKKLTDLKSQKSEERLKTGWTVL